jgi:FixJ family two-component response regulator
VPVQAIQGNCLAGCRHGGTWPGVASSHDFAMKPSDTDTDTETSTPAVSRDAPVVFVVDDDASVRESLDLLICSGGWRAETFASAEDFLVRTHTEGPCCLVLDLSLPALSGLEVQERIIDRVDMPIIFITGYGDVPTTVQAMKAGALEFLTKPLRVEVLEDAITRAIEASRKALARAADLRALGVCYASLTARQQQIMAFVVAGLLNKQIAAELGISEVTVKAHRGQVMRKMEVESLAQLVRVSVALELPFRG